MRKPSSTSVVTSFPLWFHVMVVLDSTKSMFKILLWIGGQDGSLVRTGGDVSHLHAHMVSVLIFLGEKVELETVK